jgi:CO/xanthine dehydrogenase FAD-binding subunit
MAPITSYHRPGTLDEALALIGRDGVATAVLGGGTVLNADPGFDGELVDLQGLGLGTVERSGTGVEVGAMVRLQTLVDDERVPPLLRELAHREAPATFRNAATVGGTVAAADPESVLVAGFLVHQAVITVVRPGATEVEGLAAVLADRGRLAGGLITSMTVEAGGDTAWASTARTPADRPIVAVVGRRSEQGEIRLAATGVAPTPVLIDADGIDALDPPGDFRGTADYRRHLATVLTDRVLDRLS